MCGESDECARLMLEKVPVTKSGCFKGPAPQSADPSKPSTALFLSGEGLRAPSSHHFSSCPQVHQLALSGFSSSIFAMPAMSATPHLDALERDGYVVVPNLLGKYMLLAQKGASKYVTDKAREGRWPHIRTVGKQYPPWPKWEKGDQHNIWGVQHLLHPEMTVRDTFAALYFSDEVLDVVKELVGLKDDPEADDKLVMELFNLLVSPSENKDFELEWHRDDIRPDASPEEEEKLLAEKSPNGHQLHAQYNIALFDDASLIVVPGSHKRVRTETERNADPYEPNLPDQVVVELKSGDAVFYNSNILHRGIYRGINYGPELGRMTLHGSVGLAGHGTERARQVLQHSVGDWAAWADFSFIEGPQGKRAEAMRNRLISMGDGKELGYSLQG